LSPNIAYRRDEPLVTDYSSNDHLENPENGSKSPLSLETGGLRGSIRVDGEEVSPVAKTPQLQNNNNVDCLWLAIATTFPPTVTEALARNPLFSELFGGTGENSRSVVNEVRVFKFSIYTLHITINHQVI
jgi:hypothetical protein